MYSWDPLIFEFQFPTTRISSAAEKLLLKIACMAMGREVLTVLSAWLLLASGSCLALALVLIIFSDHSLPSGILHTPACSFAYSVSSGICLVPHTVPQWSRENWT